MNGIHACRSGDGGATTQGGLLLITHRGSALKVADSIVVLRDRKTVAKGTYKELAKKKDSELYELMAVAV